MTATQPQLEVNPRPYARFDPPLQIGSTPQLLFDDFLLTMAPVDRPDQLAHGVRFSLGTVQKHASAVMTAEAPWETGLAWLTVLREDGLFRMWYNAYHPDHRGLRVSYAESDDGISWRRRPLDLVEVAGSTQNNVVFSGGHGGLTPELGNVFKDANAYPGEEYKLIYAEWIDRELFEARIPGIETNGALRGASSPDGLRWTRYTKNFWKDYPDSQNSACWDETLQKYVIYHRWGSDFAGVEAGSRRVVAQRRGRAVGRMESLDFFRDWSNPEVAVAPDLVDGLDTDIYNSAYSRHPDDPHAHYLFPSFYRHYEGTFEVQVCTSRDNRTWQRACRDTFIPLGASGELDCFSIAVAPGIVQVDDETWALYYRSGDGPHAGAKAIVLDYATQSRVSRVTFKRDRVVGLEADADGGRFSTRSLAFSGRRLTVNAEPTGADPELRVQLLDADTREPLPGYTFDDCRPISEDSIRAPVAWQNETLGADVARDGVRLHFSVRAMRVYSFRFHE